VTSAALPLPTSPPPRLRASVDYALSGDLRFLSHHDELRMLTRALIRARWPIAYSQGFNPSPRITIPLPRGLGIAADAQLAVITLAAGTSPSGDELAAALSATLPAGCTVARVVVPAPRATPRAVGMYYDVQLTPADAAALAPRLPAALAEETWVVQREDGPGRPTRAIDIRPYVTGLDLAAGRLRMDLRIDHQRSARPVEVLTTLGLAAATYAHHVRRGAVQWTLDNDGPENGPAEKERIYTLGEDNE
jgi:radical SAM-linked protein